MSTLTLPRIIRVERVLLEHDFSHYRGTAEDLTVEKAEVEAFRAAKDYKEYHVRKMWVPDFLGSDYPMRLTGKDAPKFKSAKDCFDAGAPAARFCVIIREVI